MDGIEKCQKCELKVNSDAIWEKLSDEIEAKLVSVGLGGTSTNLASSA